MNKYIIVLSLSSLLFWQCKPETKSENLQENIERIDTIKLEKTTTLNDISLQQIDSLMKMKNDTLYVYNFWATWCPPCKQELPDFIAMQNSQNDKKYRIIFISIDEYVTKTTTVVPFVSKSGMNDAYIFSGKSPDEVKNVFPDMDGIPYTVFLKNGKKETHIGSMTREMLQQKINENLLK